METVYQSGIAAHALARRGRLVDLADFLAAATGALGVLDDLGLDGLAMLRAGFGAAPDWVALAALAGLALPPAAGWPGFLPAGF